jgi:hypothetical protein
VGVPALERLVDQQLVRAAVGAGAQRHVGHGLAQGGELRRGLALGLGQDRGRQRGQVALRAVGVEVAELPRERERQLRRRRAGDRRVQPERQGRDRPAHRCISVAAAHVPTSESRSS